MLFLQDEIIRLRAVEPQDADIMWEFESDSTQWQDNGMMAPYSRHNLREYALNYDADPVRAGQIRFVIETYDERNDANARKEIVGLLDVFEISTINRTAFLGVYIKPSRRRENLAIRSITLSENYLRQLLNLRILAAKICSANLASVNLFVKCGYVKSGEFPDWILNGSRTHSLLLFTKCLA